MGLVHYVDLALFFNLATLGDPKMEITFNLKSIQTVRILRCGMLICASRSTDFSVTEDGWTVNRRTFFSKTNLVELENGYNCSLAIKLEYLEKANQLVSGKLIVQYDHLRINTKRIARMIRYLTRKGVECYNPGRVIRCWDELHNLVGWEGTLQN
jgi:hypothetical protein